MERSKIREATENRIQELKKLGVSPENADYDKLIMDIYNDVKSVEDK